MTLPPRFAKMVNAPVLLVGDIDRGGVFAQLYGTIALLEEDERQRIKGTIVNKFRGDKAILEPGLKQLEELCGVPVVGVVPYRDGGLVTPDSVEARYWFRQAAEQGLTVAQYALGKLLLSDDHEVRNPVRGIGWLTIAAENGSHYAAYRLGKEYWKGNVVVKDTGKALGYLE